ncbi:MAG: DUF2946 family protein [Gemmatimonadota bacterium]
MPKRIRYASFLGRFGLLVGTLAFVAGATVEPLVHQSAAPLSAYAPLSDDGGEKSDRGSLPHDEPSCVVCQLLGATVVLPSPPSALLVTVGTPAPDRHPSPSPRPARHQSAHSRAPPVV